MESRFLEGVMRILDSFMDIRKMHSEGEAGCMCGLDDEDSLSGHILNQVRSIFCAFIVTCSSLVGSEYVKISWGLSSEQDREWCMKKRFKSNGLGFQRQLFEGLMCVE
jgi:hypothetical protein